MNDGEGRNGENGEAEHEQGWYFPPSIVCLYRQGEINAEEMMLLGKINALCHGSGRCWASNKWLGEWWAKHPIWVSRCVSKFHKLGLITIKIKEGYQREIRVDFQVVGVKEKSNDPANKKLSRGKTKPLKTSTNELNDLTRGASHSRVGVLSSSNGEHQDRPSRLVGMFVELSIAQRWHVGKHGSTRSGWQKRIIQDWEKCCRELVAQLGEDWRRVRRVLKWYAVHCKDEYVPKCRTMKTFCERFTNLEDAIRRSNKGEDPEEEEFSPTINAYPV